MSVEDIAQPVTVTPLNYICTPKQFKSSSEAPALSADSAAMSIEMGAGTRWEVTQINFLNEIMKFMPRTATDSITGYNKLTKKQDQVAQSFFNNSTTLQAKLKDGKDSTTIQNLFGTNVAVQYDADGKITQQGYGMSGLPNYATYSATDQTANQSVSSRFSQTGASFQYQGVNFHPTAVDFQHTAQQYASKDNNYRGVDYNGTGDIALKNGKTTDAFAGAPAMSERANLTTTAYTSTEFSENYLSELGLNTVGIVDYRGLFGDLMNGSRFAQDANIQIDAGKEWEYNKLNLGTNTDIGDFAGFLGQLKALNQNAGPDYVPNFYEIARASTLTSGGISSWDSTSVLKLAVLMLESRRRFMAGMGEVFGPNSAEVNLDTMVTLYGNDANDFNSLDATNAADPELNVRTAAAQVSFWRTLRENMQARNMLDAPTATASKYVKNLNLDMALQGVNLFKDSSIPGGYIELKDLRSAFAGYLAAPSSDFFMSTDPSMDNQIGLTAKEQTLLNEILKANGADGIINNTTSDTYTYADIAKFAEAQEQKCQQKFIDIKMIDYFNRWMFGETDVKTDANGKSTTTKFTTDPSLDISRGYYSSQRRTDKANKSNSYLKDDERTTLGRIKSDGTRDTGGDGSNGDQGFYSDWKGQFSSQADKNYFGLILDMQRYSSFAIMQLFGDPDGENFLSPYEKLDTSKNITAVESAEQAALSNFQTAFKSKLNDAFTSSSAITSPTAVSGLTWPMDTLKSTTSSSAVDNAEFFKNLNNSFVLYNIDDIKIAMTGTTKTDTETLKTAKTSYISDYYTVMDKFTKQDGSAGSYTPWKTAAIAALGSATPTYTGVTLNSKEVLTHVLANDKKNNTSELDTLNRYVTQLSEVYDKNKNIEKYKVLDKIKNTTGRAEALQKASSVYLSIQEFINTYSDAIAPKSTAAKDLISDPIANQDEINNVTTFYQTKYKAEYEAALKLEYEKWGQTVYEQAYANEFNNNIVAPLYSNLTSTQQAKFSSATDFRDKFYSNISGNLTKDQLNASFKSYFGSASTCPDAFWTNYTAIQQTHTASYFRQPFITSWTAFQLLVQGQTIKNYSGDPDVVIYSSMDDWTKNCTTSLGPTYKTIDAYITAKDPTKSQAAIDKAWAPVDDVINSLTKDELTTLLTVVGDARALINKVLTGVNKLNNLVEDINPSTGTINERIKNRFMDEFYMKGDFSALRLTSDQTFYDNENDNFNRVGFGWQETAGRYTRGNGKGTNIKTRMNLGTRDYKPDNDAATEEEKVTNKTSKYTFYKESSEYKNIANNPKRADLQLWHTHALKEMWGYLWAITMQQQMVSIYNSGERAQADQENEDRQQKYDDEVNAEISNEIAAAKAAEYRAHLASLASK